jgi:hypothetical protein
MTVRALERGFESLSKNISVLSQNLLGCTAVFLIEYRPTFQRCVLPPSSGNSVTTGLHTCTHLYGDNLYLRSPHKDSDAARRFNYFHDFSIPLYTVYRI